MRRDRVRELVNTALSRVPGSRNTAGSCPVLGSVPPLSGMADLLCWQPVRFAPLAWRDAFDAHLESRASSIFAQSESDDCLAQSLALLPQSARRRFLRAPAVAAILQRHEGNKFDGQLFAELLLAELAAVGVATELPQSRWTARGDRFLNRSAPERWTLPGTVLGDTRIAVDEESSFQFPDDEFGIAETVPHDTRELEVVVGRVLTAVAALRNACAPALALVTALTEVLALRREPAEAKAFYSSTFSGCPGLVRLTNAHLPNVDTATLVEALVHEAIHCILHLHEELEEPFVRTAEANHAKVVSPWTGATIRLQSYIHACAVWYGIYWLWSMDGFVTGDVRARAETLRQRAYGGFQHYPVSVGLAPFDGLLTKSIKEFLQELEERMLAPACGRGIHEAKTRPSSSNRAQT